MKEYSHYWVDARKRFERENPGPERQGRFVVTCETEQRVLCDDKLWGVAQVYARDHMAFYEHVVRIEKKGIDIGKTSS